MRRVACLATVLAVMGGTAPAASASTSDVYAGAVRADRMNQRGHDGSGVVVAVVDTGIADVPELDGTVLVQKNISGAPSAGDQYGHGTFVAGLIHRTAPGVKFVSVKLSGADGSVDQSQVLAAMQWIVAHKDTYGIDVVNLSFGVDSPQSYRVSPVNYAVERAWDAGLVVVVSSGNLGSQAGAVTKPGDDPLVLTVGSSDDGGTRSTDDDVVADFSSRGPTADGLPKPDVIAPGVGVESVRAPGSTVDTEHPEARVGSDDFRGSGTSFSTPIVSGVVAQLLSYAPGLTPDEVKARLVDSARPIAGDAAAQGGGVVDSMAARHELTRPAAQAIERSNGQGSLQDARGSSSVEILGFDLLTVTGEMTAQGTVFDRSEYLGAWGASRWGSSQWEASRWGASRWGASRWGASSWWASRWG